jgi:hypothetical protein
MNQDNDSDQDLFKESDDDKLVKRQSKSKNSKVIQESDEEND